jgi:hypothetical protein
VIYNLVSRGEFGAAMSLRGILAAGVRSASQKKYFEPD